MILVLIRTVLLVQRPWTNLWKGSFINTNYYYYYYYQLPFHKGAHSIALQLHENKSHILPLMDNSVIYMYTCLNSQTHYTPSVLTYPMTP